MKEILTLRQVLASEEFDSELARLEGDAWRVEHITRHVYLCVTLLGQLLVGCSWWDYLDRNIHITLRRRWFLVGAIRGALRSHLITYCVNSNKRATFGVKIKNSSTVFAYSIKSCKTEDHSPYRGALLRFVGIDQSEPLVIEEFIFLSESNSEI